jgi:RNA-binding protein
MLSGKQKRHLRALGQSMPAEVQLGKAGMTDGVLDDIRARLARRELLKVRLGEDVAGTVRKQQAVRLAEATQTDLAGVVGRTVLLYRANPELPPDRRIQWT